MSTIPPSRSPDDDLDRKLDLCESALKQARRLAASGTFVPLCARLLSRAGDVLDEVDEALAGQPPSVARSRVARQAELHRELEDIQLLIPREYRWQQRVARGAGREAG